MSSFFKENSTILSKKILIIQTIIPHYRMDFFYELHKRFPNLKVVHSTELTLDGLVTSNQFNFPNLKVKIWKKIFIYQPIVFNIIKSDYDFIVLGLELKILSNFLIWLFSFLKGYKIIWWTHGYNVHKRRKDLVFFIDRFIKTFCLKRCHKILLYTKFNLEELLKRGINQDRIIILNNAINEIPHQRALNEVTKEKIREIERKTKKSQHTLLFIGRLTKNKRVDLVLQLSMHLKNIFSDLRVFIIGDGHEKQKLESMKQKMGLDDYVFFGGSINDPKKLAPYFKSADFSILPGAVGLSVVTSFAYGVPFLTLKNANHNPEFAYIKNGYNGYVANNLEDMIKWLINNFNNPTKIANMKQNCLDFIKSSVNFENMINQFIKAFS